MSAAVPGWKQWFTGRRLVIGVPFLFLLVFFLFPFLIVGKISVSEMETVTFKDVLSYQDGVLALHAASSSNYLFLAEDEPVLPDLPVAA